MTCKLGLMRWQKIRSPISVGELNEKHAKHWSTFFLRLGKYMQICKIGKSF